MKRPAKRILLFLLLGAIVNITIAWVLECLASPANVLSVDLTNAEAQSAMPLRSAPATAPLTGVSGSRMILPGRTQYVLFAFHHEVTNGVSIRYANQLLVYQAGWPWRSMYGWTGIGVTPTEIGRHRLWRPQWMRQSSLFAVAATHGLPTGLLWPGFALDTLFYAALGASLWLVFTIPFALRRWRRAKRGLCRACAYPMGTSDVCTECGAPLPLPPGVGEEERKSDYT